MTEIEINQAIAQEGIDTNLISDGYHTFGELYDHRIENFITVCRLIAKKDKPYGHKHFVWTSRRHSDGELAFGGTWFVLGIGTKEGEQMTYHLPMDRWQQCAFANTVETAPAWDGHTSADVLERLKHL